MVRLHDLVMDRYVKDLERCREEDIYIDNDFWMWIVNNIGELYGENKNKIMDFVDELIYLGNNNDHSNYLNYLLMNMNNKKMMKARIKILQNKMIMKKNEMSKDDEKIIEEIVITTRIDDIRRLILLLKDNALYNMWLLYDNCIDVSNIYESYLLQSEYYCNDKISKYYHILKTKEKKLLKKYVLNKPILYKMS